MTSFFFKNLNSKQISTFFTSVVLGIVGGGGHIHSAMLLTLHVHIIVKKMRLLLSKKSATKNDSLKSKEDGRSWGSFINTKI